MSASFSKSGLQNDVSFANLWHTFIIALSAGVRGDVTVVDPFGTAEKTILTIYWQYAMGLHCDPRQWLSSTFESTRTKFGKTDFSVPKICSLLFCIIKVCPIGCFVDNRLVCLFIHLYLRFQTDPTSCSCTFNVLIVPSQTLQHSVRNAQGFGVVKQGFYNGINIELFPDHSVPGLHTSKTMIAS